MRKQQMDPHYERESGAGDDQQLADLEEQEMMEDEQREKWEQLSNEEEAIEEERLQPDYVIDRPPTPEFIPNESGINMETQVDPAELFNFDKEAEPILQVLIGKATENARVEVIEEFEVDKLDSHKKQFLQVKEAELIETQRMEAARNRRRREMERRALQHRTAKDQRYRYSIKQCARSMAKNFLKDLRNDTFQEMRDTGLLRDPRQYSLISHFMPALQNQALAEIHRKREFLDGCDGYTMNTLRGNARVHKDAIHAEAKRIKEREDEEIRIQQEKDAAKKRRKEARAAAREKRRVIHLKNSVISTLVNNAPIADTLKVETNRITDVRSTDQQEGSVYLIGGLMGQLLLTFTVLFDYILSNPHNQEFKFTKEAVMVFLKDFLIGLNFPANALTLTVSEKQAPVGDEEEGIAAESLTPDEFKVHCLTPEYINDYGLKFFFEKCREFGISKELIDVFYTAIVEIAKYEEKQPEDLPELKQPEVVEGEEPKEATEEEKTAHEKEVSAAKSRNLHVEEQNENMKQLKEKVKVDFREVDYKENNECCVVKIENYRDPPVEGEGEDEKNDSKFSKSKLSSKHDDTAEAEQKPSFDDFSPRVLTPLQRNSEVDTILLHTEAQFELWKVILELAKKNFPELEKLALNDTIFGALFDKSNKLEQEFVDHLVANLKFDEAKILPVFEFANNQNKLEDPEVHLNLNEEPTEEK